jgi:hypothetical protein
MGAVFEIENEMPAKTLPLKIGTRPASIKVTHILEGEHDLKMRLGSSACCP